jgi:hypothetical protein
MCTYGRSFEVLVLAVPTEVAVEPIGMHEVVHEHSQQPRNPRL